MVIALSAGAAEMWRWKDADGVVHYSDRPVQGAERIDVRAQNATGANVGTTAARAPRPEAPPAPSAARYKRCEVTSPTNDQVFNSVSAVMASLSIEPGLQVGHQLQVLLNGQAVQDWPAGVMSHTFLNLYRGSYTLSVRVLDGNRELCSGPAVNFHVRLPSVLAPGRQPTGKKP